MQASEFQDTAERLVQEQTEGDWRSAISRGYYAVFHHFRELFLSHGLDLGRSANAHSNLYIGLHNCGVAAAAGIAARVDSLRDDRVEADYELAPVLSQQDAMQSVQRARKIVEDFQNLLTTISAGQIVAGVREHLRFIGRIP